MRLRRISWLTFQLFLNHDFLSSLHQLLRAFGKGEPVKPWQYESRPLGAADVEIKISHCGVCASDTHVIDSGWGHTNYPYIVGHEIIGVVTQAGPQVQNLAVGDRVGVGAQVLACLDKNTCVQCANGQDIYCDHLVLTYNSKYPDGALSRGGYADYVRVLGAYVFKIPDNIPSDTAAPLL